jgi:hypothetical protein
VRLPYFHDGYVRDDCHDADDVRPLDQLQIEDLHHLFPFQG